MEFNIRKFINNIIKEELEDYKGDHEAPHVSDGESSSPIYDMVNAFGEDIYTSNAVRYFGTGLPYDHQAAHIIQSVRNKPNALITIYRSVPDLNFELKNKIKPIVDLLNYHLHYNFFPLRSKRTKEQNQMIDFLEDEKYNHIENYDEKRKLVLQDLSDQLVKLQQEKIKPLSINDGDWVTTIKQYAIDHGKDNLNKKYKVIQKTVRAKNIYGNGDSLVEFGYSVV